MTEQVLKVLGKLDERNARSIIWVTLEQAKLIICRVFCKATVNELNLQCTLVVIGILD